MLLKQCKSLELLPYNNNTDIFVKDCSQKLESAALKQEIGSLVGQALALQTLKTKDILSTMSECNIMAESVAQGIVESQDALTWCQDQLKLSDLPTVDNLQE